MQRKTAFRIFLSFLIVVVSIELNPIIAMSQDENVNACQQAEKDAIKDTNGNIWFLAGCLGGLVGIIIANSIKPNPPSSRLLGKSPAYVATYTDCYRAKAKKIQNHSALIGCGVGVALEILYYWMVLIPSLSTTSTY